ncbi:Hypothetical protein NTJ_01642 [Nesidiocoris tenuis]|uniref:Protein Wnt n=1 Tax=Nesidiocoris tenuis TaxID=355587 RepID=A0ABN7A9E1_9HEMI|nr:Hypothetical protein NTJ_01642 [Nesidiocoris tenuis]
MSSLVLLMTAAIIFTEATGVPGRGLPACKNLAGLDRSQIDVCRRHPELTMAAMQGLNAATKECQFQFRHHRWNCSNLTSKNLNPTTSIMLKRGFRESGFAHAIMAAGVAHAVAKTCATGKILECGCEVVRGSGGSTTGIAARNWKWGGCSHNLQFGIEFSKRFLDIRESSNGDILSKVSLHNNEAGRQAVIRNMQVRCKCHGVSGSCELKTCWRAAPDMRVIGHVLKERYREAVMVEETNVAGAQARNTFTEKKRRRRRKKKKKRKRKIKDMHQSLVFFEKSPSFCDKDTNMEMPGTTGRVCNRSSRGVDSCSSLCCGRGYNIIRRRRTDRCNCKFVWCCYVTCKNCTSDDWITVCK